MQHSAKPGKGNPDPTLNHKRLREILLISSAFGVDIVVRIRSYFVYSLCLPPNLARNNSASARGRKAKLMPDAQHPTSTSRSFLMIIIILLPTSALDLICLNVGFTVGYCPQFLLLSSLLDPTWHSPKYWRPMVKTRSTRSVQGPEHICTVRTVVPSRFRREPRDVPADLVSGDYTPLLRMNY